MRTFLSLAAAAVILGALAVGLTRDRSPHALSTVAGGSTASEALATQYSSSTLFRAPGVPNPDIWNNPIPATQLVDPNSAEWGRAFAQSIGINADATIQPNTTGKRWASSYYVYVTSPGTPYRSACSRFVLNGTSWSWNQSFHNATVTNKVPVPTGTLSYDGGADHSMAILDLPSNTYYEFYKGLDPAPAGTKDPQGRPCDYLYDGGGRQRQIGTLAGQPWYAGSPGYFRNNQPVEDMLWGRQATGAMPVIGGLITPAEFNSPSETTGFGHVISVVVPFARCGVKFWPATRNDCGAGGSLPEGSLFRFPTSTDCNRWDAQRAATTDSLRKLYLLRIKGVCVTGKVYGLRVVDQTGNGFAIKMRYSPSGWESDGGSHGGLHWWNDYLDPLASAFNAVQVMAENPHPTQWAPGCLC